MNIEQNEEKKSKYHLKESILTSGEFRVLDIPPKEIIIHPWLTEQSITLITGKAGIGKSWFAMSMADSITRGISIGPWKTETCVPCLYLEAEMAVSDILERVVCLYPDESLRKQPLHLLSAANVAEKGFPSSSLLDPVWQDEMKEQLIELGVKVFFIDNLASLTPGIDENSKKEWDPINQWLLELRFAGISTVMLHHTNKDGGQRGSSAREDNIDISIMLKPPKGYSPKDGAKFNVIFSKRRIRQEHLELISNKKMHLKFDKSGTAYWDCGQAEIDNKKEVIRMISNGTHNKDIAERLGITASRVSQISGKAKDENLLDDSKGLTDKGREYLNED